MRTHGIVTEKDFYPNWLKEIFSAFTVAYRNAWTSTIPAGAIREATKKYWNNTLAKYPEDCILKAIPDAIKQHLDFPPNQYQFEKFVKKHWERKMEGERIMNKREEKLLELPCDREIAKKYLTQLRKIVGLGERS